VITDPLHVICAPSDHLDCLPELFEIQIQIVQTLALLRAITCEPDLETANKETKNDRKSENNNKNHIATASPTQVMSQEEIPDHLASTEMIISSPMPRLPLRADRVHTTSFSELPHILSRSLAARFGRQSCAAAQLGYHFQCIREADQCREPKETISREVVPIGRIFARCR
jgi:hypothetical protein